MTDDYNYWYVRSDGSFEVLCGLTCFRRWYQSGIINGRPTRWPKGSVPIALEEFCASCRGCGSIVFEPKVCLIHGGKCTEHTWLLGLDAVEFADSISQLATITDLTWDIAECLAESHPEWTGEELAMKVVKRW